MTGSVGNTITVLQYGHCSRQGNHLFFRCVYTPSKNVKNTKRKKSTIIILF